ncbi:hypothetical protein BC829DRAFT_391011, partial [Chytridium lagenaria]
MWGTVQLPTSRMFIRKKDAKVEAASLGLAFLSSKPKAAHQDPLSHQMKDETILTTSEEKKNIASIPTMSRSELNEKFRALFEYLAPTKEMRKATAELIRHISSILDTKDRLFERVSICGPYGRKTSLTFNYGLEIVIFAKDQVTKQGMEFVKTLLSEKLGAHAIIKQAEKWNVLDVTYFGIQKLSFQFKFWQLNENVEGAVTLNANGSGAPNAINTLATPHPVDIFSILCISLDMIKKGLSPQSLLEEKSLSIDTENNVLDLIAEKVKTLSQIQSGVMISKDMTSCTIPSIDCDDVDDEVTFGLTQVSDLAAITKKNVADMTDIFRPLPPPAVADAS